MGPTLYDSSPEYKNLVAHDGGPCKKGDECFFLHSDMLHESPSCPGERNPNENNPKGSLHLYKTIVR